MSNHQQRQSRRIHTVVGLLMGLFPWVGSGAIAQEPSFFDQYTAPATLPTCTDLECWLAATATCSPTRYAGEFSIGLATGDVVQEIWGIVDGDCITFSRVESLNALGQAVPEATGLLTLCVYERPADLGLEWEIFYGQAEGTFGGTGGMVDPATGVARTTKLVNDRQVAICDIYDPASAPGAQPGTTK